MCGPCLGKDRKGLAVLLVALAKRSDKGTLMAANWIVLDLEGGLD